MNIEKIFKLITDMEPFADENDPLYSMIRNIERSVDNSEELDESELEMIAAAGNPDIIKPDDK